jgi:hypothetical protein
MKSLTQSTQAGSARRRPATPSRAPARPLSLWHLSSLPGVRLLAGAALLAHAPRQLGLARFDTAEDRVEPHFLAAR